MQRLTAGTRGWLVTSKPPKLAHVQSIQRSRKVMPTVALQDKSPRLARPLARDLNTRLSLVARLSRQTILLALFRAKFTCILAISNLVFRWESCKGSEWESVKICSRLCKNAETRSLDSRLTRDWQAAKAGTRVKHAGEMKSHASCSIIGQKSEVDQAVSSQLELAIQSSHEAKSPDHLVWEKLTLRIPFSPHYI